MAINEDIENQETGDREGVRERLLVPQEKDRAGKDEGTDKGRPWMVYFTTFVAVCGSYEFGTCVSRKCNFFLKSPGPIVMVKMKRM